MKFESFKLLLLFISVSLSPTAHAEENWDVDMPTIVYIESHLVMPPHSCHLGDYSRFYQGSTVTGERFPGDITGKSVHGWYEFGGDKKIHPAEEETVQGTDQGCHRIFVTYSLETGNITAACDFSFREPRCP